MKRYVLLVAVAGLASNAGAGDTTETFSLVLDAVSSIDTTVDTTFVIAVYGDSSFGTHLLGGQFGLSSFGSANFVSDIRWTPAAWSTANDPGEYDGNGNLTGVIFGQLVVMTDLFDFLPGAGSELGGQIGSFEVDIMEGFYGALDFAITTDPNPDRFALKAVDVDEVARTTRSLDSSEGELILGGFSLQVVPSPSGVALLGFGGLAVSRRRR